MTVTAPKIERLGARLEVRATGRAGGRRLEGYAALYNVEARIGSFSEIVRAGAFAGTLATRRDVLALVDHDPGRLLARTKSGTLRLAEDTRGLSFDLDVPDTQAGRDALALAERGDLGGMSFGFAVADQGEEWRGDTRELVKLDLFEISIVQAWPAYQGTSITARSQLARPLDRRAMMRRYLDMLEGAA